MMRDFDEEGWEPRIKQTKTFRKARPFWKYSLLLKRSSFLGLDSNSNDWSWTENVDSPTRAQILTAAGYLSATKYRKLAFGTTLHYAFISILFKYLAHFHSNHTVVMKPV